MEKNAPHRISFTAWIVIYCLLALHNSKRTHALVSADDASFYRHVQRHCATQFAMLRVLAHVPYCIGATLVDAILAKGVVRHYALRKRAIYKLATEAIDQTKAVQCVVLGGGFDLLALKLAGLYPELKVFEIDRPGMNAHKTAIFARAELAMPLNLTLVAADLAEQPLEEVLAAQEGFSKAVPTLFVAEGISMYLSMQDMQRLLAALKALSPQGSFIFTAIADQKKRKPSLLQRFCGQVLRITREDFNFGVDIGDMPAFLQENGYGCLQAIGYSQLQVGVVNHAQQAVLKKQNGEYVVAASMLS